MLFLLLGGDRLPLRARWLARELSRPCQQERGRRIFGCNARELLGGGGEVARAIAREPLAIGVRASQHVGRDLTRDAERLENAHRLGAAVTRSSVPSAAAQRSAARTALVA